MTATAGPPSAGSPASGRGRRQDGRADSPDEPTGETPAPPTLAPIRRSHRVRLEDVAARAGVTKSVASRALNDDPTLHVRDETRDRIRAAAAALGYRPHAGARALAVAEAKALALLIPDLTNATYSRIARGAFRRALARGYVLLLAEDTGDLSVDEPLTDLVASGGVDGLLVASAFTASPLVDMLGRAQVPHVFVNRSVPGSGRNITMDVEAASVMAVQHLVSSGRTVIGHVAGPSGVVPAQQRERGFRQAARDLGIHAAPVERDAFTEQGGYLAAQRLLDTHPPIDALYVSTLTQSIGVLRALRERGARVPEDVAVVSFDEMPLAEYLDPSLTTISMPLDELGAQAVDALLDQVQGGPARDVLIPIAPQIIRRQSA